jgi:hypothetical protein
VVRRLTPLVLAAVIAFAPAALVFCEASCAEHASTWPPVEHATHHHHESPAPESSTPVVVHRAHHESFLPQVTTDVKATSHRCTLGDRLPVAAGVSLTMIFAPAVLSAPLVVPDVPATTRSSQDTAFRAPPHPSALITQLRI